MPMSDEMKRHLIKHNVLGLVNGGMNIPDAVDMAWDLSEPLFSERLRMKRKNIIGSGAAGQGHGYHQAGGGGEGAKGG